MKLVMGTIVPDETELDILKDVIEEAELPVEVDVDFGIGWGTDDPTDPMWYDDTKIPDGIEIDERE